MEAVEIVKANIVISHVFWAALCAMVRAEVTDKVPRMATDMRKIYINPEWFKAQRPGVQKFGYVHELAHKFALHDVRRQGRDPDLWNQAGDHEINLRLKKAGFEIWDQCLCDERFDEMTAEQIYEIIKKEQQEGGGRGKGNSNSDGKNGLDGDLLPSNMSDAEQAAEKQEVMRAVAQAATLAQQAGQMSADLQRFVDSILRPKQPWWEHLRIEAKRIVRAEENWSVRNRRFRDFYLPGMRSYAAGEVILIGDTSGSITEQDMRMIFGITCDCVEELRPSSLRCIWWDADFKGEQEFTLGETPLIRPVGGGGTRMDLALKYVEDNYEPEAVLLVTDGQTPWPDHEMPFPLLVLSTGRPSPIGLTIHVSV